MLHTTSTKFNVVVTSFPKSLIYSCPSDTLKISSIINYYKLLIMQKTIRIHSFIHSKNNFSKRCSTAHMVFQLAFLLRTDNTKAVFVTYHLWSY